MDIVPENAIAVFSGVNDNPLVNRYATDRWVLGEVATVSETRITTTQSDPHDVASAFYLGALVSPDRETIYWVNNTAPLP